MDKIKIILKGIIFVTIGLIIFQLLTLIFVPKWTGYIDPATPRWQEFYEEKKNTIDVLLIGNSDVGRGLSPITLWKEYGITSFNLGTSNQTMGFSYYIIKEVIEYQNIKTIVLDMDALFVKADAPEGEYRKLFDNMKMGKTKLEVFQDENINIDNKLSYIFPLLRFHSRWNELEKNDLRIHKNYDNTNSYKGMAMSNAIKPYIDNKKYMADKGKVETIPTLNLEYTKKIIELCKEKNIKLLMIELPSASSWSSAKSKATNELAKENGIEFIDMNYLLDELNFDWLTDTADKGNHLNIDGAEKVSRYLGEILSTKYNCIDHKEDFQYEEWNKEVKRYEENKKKLNNKKDTKSKNVKK